MLGFLYRSICFLFIFALLSLLVLKDFEKLNQFFLKRFPRKDNDHSNCSFSKNNSVLKSNLSWNSDFLKVLSRFPWSDYQEAIKTSNASLIRSQSTELISILTPFLVREPKHPINSSCQAPPLRSPSELKCQLFNRERKVGLLLQFGFDVDTLEIHLNELGDLVDHFFLIESTRTHSRISSNGKPLLWSQLKHQTRFNKFSHKVIHLILDDVSTINMTINVRDGNNDSRWDMERFQEKMRWIKFTEWNAATRFFNDDDIIGFGDVDEIASRESVNYLKHCNLPSDPVDVGIWFPYGFIDQAFLTDFPVFKHGFTLGDPTFWTLRATKNKTLIQSLYLDYPSRNRGQSPKSILGGMHMSNYGYLPYQLIKRLTATEQRPEYFHQVSQFPIYLKQFNNSLAAVEIFYTQQIFQNVRHRIFKLSAMEIIDPQKDEIVVLPWFYNCNRLRYPTWEKKLDERLV